MPVPRRTVDFTPRALAVAAFRTAAPRTGAVGELEAALARALDVPHVVAASSGRAACGAILRALGLDGTEREVVVPAFTDESVPAVVCAAGCVPRYVDADPLDANPDAAQIGLALGPASGAVIAAHHFGRVADLDAITRCASALGVPVIEDATHAVGARWHGQPVGTVGAAGYLSFNFTKPLTGFGGGAVVTRDATLARTVRELLASRPPEARATTLRRALKGAALWLVTRRTVFSLTAYPLLRLVTGRGRDLVGTYKSVADRAGGTATSGPMNEVAAAVLLDRLGALPGHIARRRELESVLCEHLDPEVPRLANRPGSEGVAYFSVVCVPDRPGLARRLLAHGLDTGHDVLRDVARLARGTTAPPAEAFPVTTRLVAESLQVPNHPGVRRADVVRAAHLTNAWWKAHAPLRSR